MRDALDGGTITGEGASVTFEPPDTGPHPCPYHVGVAVTSDQSGLSTARTLDIYVHLSGDNDEDGEDLAIMAESSIKSGDLAAFAERFGKDDGCSCPQSP